MVDTGNLTSSEKAELLETLESNVKSINEEIALASSEGKHKKVEKLEEKRHGIMKRKEAVASITPVERRLQHGISATLGFIMIILPL
jgi:hypothetical protein